MHVVSAVAVGEQEEQEDEEEAEEDDKAEEEVDEEVDEEGEEASMAIETGTDATSRKHSYRYHSRDPSSQYRY